MNFFVYLVVIVLFIILGSLVYRRKRKEDRKLWEALGRNIGKRIEYLPGLKLGR